MTKPNSSARQWAWLLALFGGVGALGWFRASRRPAPPAQTAPAQTAPAQTAPALTAPALTAPAKVTVTPSATTPQLSASFIEAPTGTRRIRTPTTRTLTLAAVTPQSAAPTPSTTVQTRDLALYNIQRFRPPPPRPKQPQVAVIVEETKEPVAESRVAEETKVGPTVAMSVIPTHVPVSKAPPKAVEEETKEPTQVTVLRPQSILEEKEKRKDTDVTFEPKAVSVAVETPLSGILIQPSTSPKEKSQAQQLIRQQQDEKTQQLVQQQDEKAQQQKRQQEQKERTERLRVGNRRDQTIQELLEMNRILSEGPPKPKGIMERWFGASEPVDTSYEDLMRKLRNRKEINRLAKIVAEEHKTMESLRENSQQRTQLAKRMEAKKGNQRKAVCEAFLNEVYDNGVQLSYALMHLKTGYDTTKDEEVKKEEDVLQWLRSTTIDLITPWVHKYRAFKTEFANMGCEDPIHAMNTRVEKLGELVNKLKGLIGQMGVSWNDIA